MTEMEALSAERDKETAVFRLEAEKRELEAAVIAQAHAKRIAELENDAAARLEARSSAPRS